MGSDLPEWLEQYLIDMTGYKPIGHLNYEYPIKTLESEAVLEFYEFISKPENAAKIPVVQPLIERLNYETKYGSNHYDDCIAYLENVDESDDEENIPCNCGMQDEHEKSLEALKPFKKEGSDES